MNQSASENYSISENSSLYSAFVEKSVEETFKFLFQVNPGSIESKLVDGRTANSECSGAMLMTGESHEVLSFLGFSQSALSHLAKTVFKVTDPVEAKWLRECLGELSNVFSGAIRSRLLANGLNIPLSLPETSIGIKSELIKDGDKFLRMKFQLEKDFFFVYLSVREVSSPTKTKTA